jgi:hypothetical protein
MKMALQAAALAFSATFGISSAVDAATIVSVDVPWSDIINGEEISIDGIIYEIEQAGNYRLDFSGIGRFPNNPDFLGTAGYILAEVEDLQELFNILDDDDTFLVFDGISVNIGFLAAGVDFAALVAATGGDTTMSLVRLDDQPAPVPLPATLPLLAAAIGATGLTARRRQS